MAEAIPLPTVTRYFCYHCDREVSLTPSAQLTCPECSSGFVEEVLDEHDDPDYEDDSDVDESELNLLNLLSIENLFRRTAMSPLGEYAESPRRNYSELPRHPYTEEPRHTYSEEPHEEGESPEPSPIVQVYSTRSLFQDLEDSFAHNHATGLRHVGDYLFGDDIDALSTMLLNETEIVGPPPLPKDQIKLLPIVAVSKEDIDKEVQCTVCMEDFAVREKAKILPCRHLYHEKCITPWLERHATCPNCRKSVETQSKSQRSQSCPRSDYNLRSADQRRSSEVSTRSGFFTANINPFRFL